jgi:phosphoribosylformylglycinamidine synthase
VPIVGGNVSLYNEAPSGPIFPTPIVGIVGRLADASQAGRLGFVVEGDAIALVGPFEPSLVGSEVAKLRGLPPVGQLPDLDAGAVASAHATVKEGVRSGAFRSAHDIAEGGAAAALAECCVAGGLGAPVIGRVGGTTLVIEGQLELSVSELRDAREGVLAEVLGSRC